MRHYRTLNFGIRRPATMDEAIGVGMEANVAEIDAMVANHIERVAEINKSNKYTAQGKRDELQRIADDADAALSAYETKLQTGYTANIAKAESKMQPPADRQSELGALLHELRRQEVRRYAASLGDPLKLEMYYRQAIADGNELVADALEQDPTGGLRFHTPDLVQTMRIERLARRYPEAAAEYRDYSHVWVELRSAFAHARRALASEGLVLKSRDPIETAAA